jgi:hypothetical protein
MQNEEASTHKADPLLTQHTIEHLEDQWRSLHEPTSIALKRIIEFAMSLNEENRNAGLTAIAQHFISTLSMHYLDIMSIFQQKAEQEEIDLKEREGTFHDTLEASFPLMLGLRGTI